MSEEALAAEPAVDTEPMAETEPSGAELEVTDGGSEPTQENRTLADIIDSAFEKAENADQEGESPEPTAAKTGPERGPDGKFVSKKAVESEEKPLETPETATQTPFSIAPDRLSAEAKEAWAGVPDAVKAETHRAINELTQGLDKYREGAARWDELAEFQQMAAQYGTDVKTAIGNYVAAEQLLSTDIVGGFTQLAQQFGYDFRDIAAHVLGQEPQQQGAESQQVRQLQDQVQQLQQQLGGFTQAQQQAQQEKTMSEVDAFAAANPRFEELSGEMAKMLRTGYATDLADAYKKAEALNPLPVLPGADTAVKPDPKAQTQKGQASVTGAPATGSNPKNRGPAASPRSALDRAFDSVGL